MHASPHSSSATVQLSLAKVTLTLLMGTLVASIGGCLANEPGKAGVAHPELANVVIEAPATSATEAQNFPGVHNVVTYLPDLVCGGVPEGDEGFATLQRMGIKTIISVDGATPDLKLAQAHGLRYVHLPIGYDTVTTERQTQLAQAISNVEGPIYVHCHHGKHRSGAGLGTALVRSGRLSVDAVCERMGVSGTSKSYAGLWKSVREAEPLSKEQLKADPASFPSITKVTGMVAIMAEVDSVIDLVRQAHEAKWQAPDDHPDLVAEKETRRLANLFAALQKEPESLKHPAQYQEYLDHSIEVSAQLDEAVRSGNAIQAAQMLATLEVSCKTCHREYRNK